MIAPPAKPHSPSLTGISSFAAVRGVVAGRCAIVDCFFLGVRGEGACGDQQALVSHACHRAAEVAEGALNSYLQADCDQRICQVRNPVRCRPRATQLAPGSVEGSAHRRCVFWLTCWDPPESIRAASGAGMLGSADRKSVV